MLGCYIYRYETYSFTHKSLKFEEYNYFLYLRKGCGYTGLVANKFCVSQPMNPAAWLEDGQRSSKIECGLPVPCSHWTMIVYNSGRRQSELKPISIQA